MKTVEVAVEYVLVGLLALFAFALPFFPGALDPAWLSSEKLIGILGLAYLFGVVFDKIADTMLAPHEQYLRIAQARRNLKEGGGSTGDSVDPFPQDRLENSVRSAGDGRLEWMDALRGRIRTTRGLAVFGLPAALGIVLYLGKTGQGGAYRLGMIVPVALLCLCISSSILFSIVRTSPKTGDFKEKDITAESEAYRRQGLSFVVLMLFIAAMGGMVVVPLWSGRYELALVGIAGTAISLLSWWAWHGITRTYMRFLAMQTDAEGGR